MAVISKKITGNSLEQLADIFAGMIVQKCVDDLANRRSAVDDLIAADLLKERLNVEPGLVRKKTYARIIQVMENPSKYKEYYKKYFIFRSKSVIRITRSSGFFEGLFIGPHIPILWNEEWLIDIKRLSVVKKLYLPYYQL